MKQIATLLFVAMAIFAAALLVYPFPAVADDCSQYGGKFTIWQNQGTEYIGQLAEWINTTGDTATAGVIFDELAACFAEQECHYAIPTPYSGDGWGCFILNPEDTSIERLFSLERGVRVRAVNDDLIAVYIPYQGSTYAVYFLARTPADTLCSPVFASAQVSNVDILKYQLTGTASDSSVLETLEMNEKVQKACRKLAESHQFSA